MTSCPTYLAPFGAQIGAGATGSVDCTAWAASRLLAQATCGDDLVTGRRIRVLSNEPIPDPYSPGLNLTQVHDVLWDHFGIWTDIRTGNRALAWDEYERLRKAGRPMVMQLSYAPIAASEYDAGRGFTGGHAIFEGVAQTIDSLADGRARGVYDYAKHAPLLYNRTLMRHAAGDLVLAFGPTGIRRVGEGKVWALVGQDTVPDFRVRIKPRRGHRLRRVRVFSLAGGVIRGYDVRTVREPLDARCSIPRGYRWPSKDGALRFLVKVDNPGGKLDGKWINWHWADPIAEVGTGGDPLLDDTALPLLDADDPDEVLAEVKSDPVPTLPDDPTGDA